MAVAFAAHTANGKCEYGDDVAHNMELNWLTLILVSRVHCDKSKS